MSEFSESLHFRLPTALNDDALYGAMEAASLGGLLMSPSRGWRTFVPFESASDSDLADERGARLSLVVGQPVLEYRFAEDYYWAFCVWDNGDLMTVYTCDLQKKKKPKVGGEVEWEIFGALLPPESPVSMLQALLMEPLGTCDAGREQAKRFAKLMGLEHFEFVGPHNIHDVIQDARAQSGYVLVGTPPAE